MHSGLYSIAISFFLIAVVFSGSLRADHVAAAAPPRPVAEDQAEKLKRILEAPLFPTAEAEAKWRKEMEQWAKEFSKEYAIQMNKMAAALKEVAREQMAHFHDSPKEKRQETDPALALKQQAIRDETTESLLAETWKHLRTKGKGQHGREVIVFTALKLTMLDPTVLEREFLLKAMEISKAAAPLEADLAYLRTFTREWALTYPPGQRRQRLLDLIVPVEVTSPLPLRIVSPGLSKRALDERLGGGRDDSKDMRTRP